MADAPRVGIGFDVHPREEGRPMWLGGLRFEGVDGLAGHSDGDAVCHAVADALLGGAALGDVGTHFPETDPALAGIGGVELLGRAVSLVRDAGFDVASGDVTVICERPAIAPRRDEMRARGARACGGRRRLSRARRAVVSGQARGDARAPVVVAGRRAVTEAIRAGAAREVLIVETPKATQGLRAVLDAARDAGVGVTPTSREALDALATDHQGVVARVRADAGGGAPVAAPTLSERQLAETPFAEDAVVVVLDGITDPQNLGAAARSAEAVGAAMLVTRTRRAADVTPAAVRASAGALMHLPHARVANVARAIGRLQDAGFWVIGLDGEAEPTIYDEPCPPGRVAVVIGSEGTGMSRLVRESCDALVRLPMLGHVGSLNASASLAATLYAYVLPSRSLSGP